MECRETGVPGFSIMLRKNYGSESLGGSPRIYAGVGALQRSGKLASDLDAL